MNSSSRIPAPVMAVVGSAALLGLGVWLGRRSSSNSSKERRRKTQWINRELRPPFPDEIVALLNSASLCYLSTTLDDSPHLSLMTFTYHQPSQKIIFSTRRDTQKCAHLESNPRVAILIHDFPSQRGSAGRSAGEEEDDVHSAAYESGTYSITLYGEASVLPDGPEAERLRAVHLERSSPQAGVFIQGEGIAVVVIDVECARVCDSQDKVTTWTTAGGWGGGAPPKGGSPGAPSEKSP